MGCVVTINIKHGPTVQRWLVTSRLVKFASLYLTGSTNKQSGLWYEDSAGYCSPVTQAAVWYVPSCWPLSEQCQVKFLSWPVLRSHSISNTNSTTVTLLWWAAGTQKQDLGSISERSGRPRWVRFENSARSTCAKITQKCNVNTSQEEVVGSIQHLLEVHPETATLATQTLTNVVIRVETNVKCDLGINF